ncbi:hypothetical protein NP493_1158g00045 [Ridgeia piscesae]|uniref:MULE transposase domain-containing protein n=1 Tax=Ridgeia piscesae TaxID=27915 RepID=A0AAD9KF57_RIDPI|nr:hypothetical protein NP493_1158g00045 [Ridgeia piscesae]
MDIFVRNSDAANVKCVMADKDMMECDVIREKLPGAALQICLFHVLRTFRREVTTEKLGIRSDERLVYLEIMQKMAYVAGEVSAGDSKWLKITKSAIVDCGHMQAHHLHSETELREDSVTHFLSLTRYHKQPAV